MSKPDWLKDREEAARIARKANLCCECAYYGDIVDYTRHRDAERVTVHECDIHPKCLNTRFSICCDDWTPVNPAII